MTAASIKGKGPAETVQRYLVDQIISHPRGWLTLWGDYGTAKTMTAQAIVAGLVRAGKSARFYRASQIEQAWFKDLHEDRNNAEMFRELPALAIDELDKVNLRSEWIRERFQDLMDYRYRQAVAGQQLTLITLQYEPASCLPGDIVSRMNDGRFYRPWTGGANPLVIERWGEKVLPGCINIAGEDARPKLAPDFVINKKKGHK